jgi:hypothetical protein
MSREQSRRLVEDLERDLRQALTIEPSADFARQVRGRIERTPRRTWLPVELPWLAAAAAVILIALAAWWQTARLAQPLDRVPARTTAAVDVLLERAPEPAPSPKPDIVVPVRRIVRPASVDVSPEPEVLVSPDAARALARFLQLTRSGAVNGDQLPAPASSAPPDDLSIIPLVVPSIPVPVIDIPGGPAPSGAGPQ